MAYLMPPVPLLADIPGMPLTQLQAYCLVYELPTISQRASDMRANLRRLRLLYQGDSAMLTDNDRRVLFDSWGIEGDWGIAPSDNIAVVLIGYAISMAMRYNALAYCRSPLTVTAKNPTVLTRGSGVCGITVEVDAATGAGLPLTGTGECDITLSVDSKV